MALPAALAAQSGSYSFDDAQQFLKSHCQACHQGSAPAGGFPVQQIATAATLTGIPFTFQRLCELLTSPSKHYKRTEKFLRAVEKNINVVTTVTLNGERVTGTDEIAFVARGESAAAGDTSRDSENGLPTRPKNDEKSSNEPSCFVELLVQEAVVAEMQQQPERVEADSPAPKTDEVSGSDDSLKDGDKDDQEPAKND